MFRLTTARRCLEPGWVRAFHHRSQRPVYPPNFGDRSSRPPYPPPPPLQSVGDIGKRLQELEHLVRTLDTYVRYYIEPQIEAARHPK